MTGKATQIHVICIEFLRFYRLVAQIMLDFSIEDNERANVKVERSLLFVFFRRKRIDDKLEVIVVFRIVFIDISIKSENLSR